MPRQRAENAWVLACLPRRWLPGPRLKARTGGGTPLPEAETWPRMLAGPRVTDGRPPAGRPRFKTLGVSASRRTDEKEGGSGVGQRSAWLTALSAANGTRPGCPVSADPASFCASSVTGGGVFRVEGSLRKADIRPGSGR